MIYRFRSPGWRGPMHLCVSVLDVLVYAIVLSFVAESVFQLDGQNRFVLMLIGLIALRWTLSCALQASRVAHFVDVARPYYRNPVLATLILAIGPPSFIFLLSVTMLGVTLLTVLPIPADAGHMLGWGLFVVMVQSTWNCLLVLVVIQVRRLGWLISEVPIVLGFILIIIVSPVVYQLKDIPTTASGILTSFNPATHLIAAYQNSFWYGQAVSLEVLPLSAALSVGLILFLFVATRRVAQLGDDPEEANPVFLLWRGKDWIEVEALRSQEHARFLKSWPNEIPWITGKAFLWLVSANRMIEAESLEILKKFVGTREARRLLDTQLPILSARNRARICVAAILPWLLTENRGTANVVSIIGDVSPLAVLDGLFDHANVSELQALTALLAAKRVPQIAIRTHSQRVVTLLSKMHLDGSSELRA